MEWQCINSDNFTYTLFNLVIFNYSQNLVTVEQNMIFLSADYVLHIIDR